MKATKLDQALSIRVTSEEMERLDALAERVRLLSRHALAREALRIGLEELEANPARLLSPPPAKPRARRKQ